MKFLFSQDHSFTSEKFGRVIFEIEKEGKKEIKNPVGVPQEVFNDKKEKRNTELKLERKTLSNSVEKEQKLKMETEGNRIFDEMQATIRKELPASQARTLTAVQYGRRIDDIGKRSQGAIDKWIKDYGRVIPSDGGVGNLKIAAVVATIAYGDTKGNMLGRLKNAAMWGAGAAAITHPALTGALAGIMSFTGKTVLAPVIGVGIPNFIFTLIDNPQSIVRALRRSGRKQTSIDSTPIYKLLAKGETERETLAKDLQTGSQNAFELQASGLVIGGPSLRNISSEMDAYENAQRLGQPRAFPDITTKSATFILQMAEHKLNEVELYNFRVAIHNEEASPEMIRRVLATNAEKDIVNFFTKNGKLKQLEAEMSAQTKSGVTPPSKADLSKIFIDGTVETGDYQFGSNTQKHGIRRFMSMGGGGMALALYAIAFLAITGIMNVRKLAQPDFWKKDVPGAGKKALTLAMAPLKALVLNPVKRGKAKNLLKHYQKAKTKNDADLFTKKQRDAMWKKMDDKDKDLLISQTKTFVKDEKDGKFKYNKLPDILKSKLAEVKKEAADTKK